MTTSRLIDMTGQSLGYLTIQSFAYRKAGQSYWNCMCRCGGLKSIRRSHLLSAAIQSCGCISTNQRHELKGRQFNRLTVLDRCVGKNHSKYWLCVCECGNQKSVKGLHLLNGEVRSCGCLRDEGLRSRSTKHGQCAGGARTKEYRRQEFARQRKKLEAVHGDDWWRYTSQYLSAVKHPETVKACRKKYKQKNKVSVLAATRERQALQLRAMPVWANKEQIKAFYMEARRLTEVTGIQHEVDHIIPLRGKYVWGFHVDGNLQILTATDNRRKSNSVKL